MSTTAKAKPEKTASAKPHRVLACVLCQQRKIKCDRKFPCGNCVKADLECMQASLTPRRRRFPERELLNRLRYYETLLRQNNINFEPLHPSSSSNANTPPATHNRGASSAGKDGPDSPADDARASASPRDHSGGVKSESIDLWQVLDHVTLDSDDDEEGDAAGDGHDGEAYSATKSKTLWYRLLRGEDGTMDNDHMLLFGTPTVNQNLAALHPDQSQIFRLWHIYLENVNPLFKITHTPTLQSRIIDAASNVSAISPTLEALIFSIYCVAVMTLEDSDCFEMFGLSRRDLLAGYQFACRQALVNTKALRSDDTETLTALLLYLISAKSQSDQRSLSSVFALAMRIAYRMRLHDEQSNVKHTVFEAEMRRRLWWALVSIDHRICEISEFKTTSLLPSWSCHTPLNVSDYELRPDMKAPPIPHDKPSEAVFAVLRSEHNDFTRHTASHLKFLDPLLSALDQPPTTTRLGLDSEHSGIDALEQVIENQYLSQCDPESPVHFMAIWMTRGLLARSRLLEHYFKYASATSHQTDAERDVAVLYSLTMLECDTQLRTNPIVKGFLWFVDFYVPTLGNIHLMNDLTKRPMSQHAEKAWEVMSENYSVRLQPSRPKEKTVFTTAAPVTLRAWDAREAALRQQNIIVEPPAIVLSMRRQVAQNSNPQLAQLNNGQTFGNAVASHGPNAPMMPTPSSLGPTSPYTTNTTTTGQPGFPGSAQESNAMDVDLDELFKAVDWNSIQANVWDMYYVNQ